MMTERQRYRVEVRSGWKRSCPFCHREIRYTILVNTFSPEPFFYSDCSNDVLLRKSDAQRMETGSPSESEPQRLVEYWDEVLRNAPVPPSGGKFSLWANIKCPHCEREFPYNSGILDLRVRLHDPYIVLIDGAVVLGDTLDESWQVSVKVSEDPE